MTNDCTRKPRPRRVPATYDRDQGCHLGNPAEAAAAAGILETVFSG
ncbi:MAG TPA: hypothetical protein VKA51_11665 [Rubrobacteraceae bacterium]|nr:hypothetical protein [Rubrobacteraceae bacterium]